MGWKICLKCKGKTLLGDVNKLFVFNSLLTMSSNVLPYCLKWTFPPIIWRWWDQIQAIFLKLFYFIHDFLKKLFSYWKPYMANIVWKKRVLFQVDTKKIVSKTCCVQDLQSFVPQIEPTTTQMTIPSNKLPCSGWWYHGWRIHYHRNHEYLHFLQLFVKKKKWPCWTS